jgi:cytochrome P450
LLDFLSPEVRRNPFPLYSRARAASPLLHDARSGLWLAFDYSGVKQILGDSRSFSSQVTQGLTAKWLVFQDEPRHAKLRALVTRAFTPASLALLEAWIRELSASLLEAVLERGEMDLVGEYAVPLPMRVIAHLIGVPTDDWTEFRRWSDVILDLSQTIPAGGRAREAEDAFRAVSAEMAEYLSRLANERTRRPREDLLTRLLHSEIDGDRLAFDEILAFLQLLLVAGHETTTNLIANAVLCLLEHPAQMDDLRKDPALLDSAIEEVLRFRSPVQWMMRVTTRTVDMHGQAVPAGAVVLPVIGSANRDGSAFPEPDRFDIRRSPNPHIAFGHGIHFCIGAALSRMEARIALPDLLTRLSALETDNLSLWEPRQPLHVHGPARLLVRFGPQRLPYRP